MTKKKASFRIAPTPPKVPKIDPVFVDPSEPPSARDPNTLTHNLATLPDNAASIAAPRPFDLANHRFWCSLHRGGKTCDCDWFQEEGRKRNDVRAIIVGIDAASDDLSAAVFVEREFDGTLRVARVVTWEKNQRPIFNDVVMRGWRCPRCKVFRGEEKETNESCSCGEIRPLLKRKEVFDDQEKQLAHAARKGDPSGT